jgi:hypothetical protein
MGTNEEGLRGAGQMRSGRRDPLLLLGVVLSALSMISVVLLILGEESSAKIWLWLSPAILLVACAGTAFRIIRADARMVVSPVFWVLLASGAYWGLGPLIYTFGNRNTIALMDYGYVVRTPELFSTNMLNSVGMLALVIGLGVGRRLVGRRPQGWVRRFEGTDTLTTAVVLAAIGLAAKFFMALPAVFGSIGTQSSTLLQMQLFSKGALVILSYLSAKKGGKATVWFIFLLLVEVLTAGIVNSKMAIFEVIIAALIGRTLAVRKTSTVVKGFLLLVVLQLVLQPVVSGYRLMVRRSALTGDANAATVLEAGKFMAQSFSDLLHGTNIAQELTPQAWWSRLCYAPQQAFVMKQYDSGNPGSFWKDFAVALIPRVLWRNKPLVTPGVNFSILFDGNANSNNAPGMLGEGYWYGGWFGLLMVSLYAGLFLGGIERVSVAVISHRAWILMPLIFIGIVKGFRVDGWFSTELLFGTIWYLLFAVGMFFFATFYLIINSVLWGPGRGKE